MKKIKMLLTLIALSGAGFAQIAPNTPVPSVLTAGHFSYDGNGKLLLNANGQTYTDLAKVDAYKLNDIMGTLTGSENGIMIDLDRPGYNGTIAYGPYDETVEFPSVAFLPKSVKIKDGKALIEMKKTFTKASDFYHLADKGNGIIGYRIIDSAGRIIYEGRVAFEGKGPYTVVPTIVQGPMVNDLLSTGCILSYDTQVAMKTSVSIGDKNFGDDNEVMHHEITVNGLKAGTEYTYTITYGDRKVSHTFTTAPAEGSRKPFTFAFASANRGTTGGGERDFGGTNYQTTRAIMGAAVMNKAVFLQCTGDFTDGGNTSEQGHMMEYANFKRALEPFWNKVPVYVGFGDHEPNKTSLRNEETKKNYSIELYPYASVSGEATFAKAFVNPQNGPQSEDGAAYDPDPSKLDFPTYKENVYYYTYGNVAMIVLNTEYWESKDPTVTSGCPEGYIMDQQVKWLKETMQKMESNPNIDHIFVNIHGAAFPNGDHLDDAMYWQGDNCQKEQLKDVMRYWIFA